MYEKVCLLAASGVLVPLAVFLKRVDRDKFTWKSTQRILDGEDLVDFPPVCVTRLK
jgi:hypothetical protein